MSANHPAEADVGLLEVTLDTDTLEELRKLANPSVPPAAPVRSEGRGPTGADPLEPTDAAITAALCDTFLAEELLDVPGTDRADLERILTHSAMVIIGGRRRLRLADGARAALLRAARGTERFHRMLVQADAPVLEGGAEDDTRRASRWIRRFLLGGAEDLSTARTEDLRAAVAALERLGGVTLEGPAPSYDDARRLLSLAELLDPLRLIIGSSAGPGGVRARDDFVGRDAEIRMLRSFVDELASESVTEAVTRAVKRTARSAAGAMSGRKARTLVIEASGGLGKTALIAKFVLDHALGGSARFPFAYLDFDRAALQPREPGLLLVEVARQVMLQFPEIEEECNELRRRIRARAAGSGQLDDLHDAFAEFRSLLQTRVTLGRHVFLLVLDTMEVTQFDPEALHGVQSFVDRLLAGGGFPELRVVAAGRADIPGLRSGSSRREQSEPYRLQPLGYTDASAMAERLGRTMLGADWRTRWAGSIVGSPHSPPMRREPLTIRVAVELLCGGANEAERDRLAAEIGAYGDRVGTHIVAHLYKKRVVEHVRDPEVKALAWPGLVLRQVTEDIAAHVLAEPCGLTPNQARAAFARLGNEVWIVQREGDALRHRADLRSRMMPLMRTYSRGGEPEGRLFHTVNRAAIAYYGSRRTMGARHVAEWIYHRLLDGEQPTAVEADWVPEVEPFLAGAGEDFEPGSEAAELLAARAGGSLLPADRLARLSPRLAVEHLARTAPEFGEMGDGALLKPLLDLRLQPAAADELTDRGRAAAFVLSVKTGRWAQAVRPSEAPANWEAHQLAASRYLRARAPDLAPQEARASENDGSDVMALAQDLAAAALWGASDFDRADWRLASALGSENLRLRREHGPALRLAMALGEASQDPAVGHWLSGLPSLWWPEGAPTLSLAEARALHPLAPFIGELFGALREERSRNWWGARQPDDDLAAPRRAQDDRVAKALRNALERLRAMGQEGRAAIRQFAGARDEDWLVPVAYAAWRAVGGAVPGRLLARLREQDEPASEGASRRRWTGDGQDILQQLRRADEASDLSAAASLFDRGNAAGSDLRELLERHESWRRRLNKVLERDSDPELYA